MKTFTYLKTILLSLVVVFALSSCNKDDNGGDVGSGTVKLKANGTSYNFKNITAASAIGLITINGETDDGKISISLMMTSTIENGEYEFNAEGSTLTALYTENDNGYFPENGTFKITSHSGKKIKGTFSFTGQSMNGETVEITDGSFDVKYDEYDKGK